MTLNVLSHYLLTFHRLPMPGIGTLILKKQSARLQILEKQIDAGGYVIEWTSEAVQDAHIISWLAGQMNMSVAASAESFQSYIDKLINVLNLEKKFEWGSWGTLEKKGEGQMFFNGAVIHVPGYAPVPAEKVVRKKSDHSVLVGDQTFSADDMQEKLQKSMVKVRHHWIIITVALLVMAVLTMIYLFVAGRNFIHSHQQQPTIKVRTAGTAYKILSKDE